MSEVVVYRVRDWDKHFENNRTRELKYLDWVPVPNKHDGDGYTELLEHENGAAHYGAWMLIVQVASKCDKVAGGCAGRGTLLRDGAKPYDATSLARVTRCKKAVFEEAIPRLIAIGWLEVISLESLGLTPNPAPACENPAPPCGKVPTERNGTEGNGIAVEREPREGEANRPSWEEVKVFADRIGLAEWKARDWLDEMLAVGWRDWNHRPVLNWQPMLTRVCRKWEADGRPATPPVTPQRQANGSTKPDHRAEKRAREYPQEIKPKPLLAITQ